MKFLKRSERKQPKISLVLLDWGVRESFHLFDYLANQSIPRDRFEVILIEYYSRISPAMVPYLEDVDTWALLEMPQTCYYHKHLMYNAGIVLAGGEIVVICDSDAMVKSSFLRSIEREFEDAANLALHLDQFRNVDQSMYPFNSPSFEEVEGAGCINWAGGKTTGVLDTRDTIHTRNYGACLAVRRDKLIEIGGADEHIDFLGHVCGPYDFSFRLGNAGCEVRWHQSEFMYHTWHPGSDGVDNYLGPHDGMNMSTTSFEAILTKRILPHLENPAIRALREGTEADPEQLLKRLIDPRYVQQWQRNRLDQIASEGELGGARPIGRGQLQNGFFIFHDSSGYKALPSIYKGLFNPKWDELHARVLVSADSVGEIRQGVRDVGRRRRILLHLVWKLSLLLAALQAAATALPPKLLRLLFVRIPRFAFLTLWGELRWLVGAFLGRIRHVATEIGTRIRNEMAKVRDRASMGSELDRKFDVSVTASPPASHQQWNTKLSDLVLNLHEAHGEITSRFSTEPVLLIDERHELRYLELLMRLGLVPRVRLRRFLDGQEVRYFLDGLEETGTETPLLVDSDLLIRFYSEIQSHPRVRSALIV